MNSNMLLYHVMCLCVSFVCWVVLPTITSDGVLFFRQCVIVGHGCLFKKCVHRTEFHGAFSLVDHGTPKAIQAWQDAEIMSSFILTKG